MVTLTSSSKCLSRQAPNQFVKSLDFFPLIIVYEKSFKINFEKK